MQAKLADQIEQATMNVASTALGLAGAWSAYTLLSPAITGVAAIAIALGAAAGLTLLGRAVLVTATGSKRSIATTSFDLLGIPVDAAADELLLTDVVQQAPQADETLILDDILAELGPESRVVRLFDRSSMPTPAQLKSRIDEHLTRTGAQVRAPDASQALHEALAELRRSIR